MTRTEDSKVVELVMVLRCVGKSSYEISNVLKERNIKLSPSGVSRMIARNSGKSKKKAKRTKRTMNPGSPKVRTKTLMRKVKEDLKKSNPLTQREVAKKHGVSQRTVWRIAHEDLQGVVRKKCRVHALSHAQVAQRLERGTLFLQYLEGEKFKKLISVDECWVYLTTCNGIRRIYYQFKGEQTEESWRKFWRVSHPKGVMCFMGVSYWGKTSLRFVEPKAKINADYIDHLLKPLCEKDIPEMFRGRKFKPVLHQDNAPAHAVRNTQEWLTNCRIDVVPKEHWMGNSPDCEIMNFCANGLFKWDLSTDSRLPLKD